MTWQIALLLLFGLLGGFCLIWIILAESKPPVIRNKPWSDPRNDTYRNWQKDLK